MAVVRTVVARAKISLLQIAKRINSEHAAFEDAGKKTLEHAAEAGRLLLAAKEEIQHGDWLGWLKENFDGSQQHANRYMRVAAGWEAIGANYARVCNLTLRGALKLIEKPRRKEEKQARKSEIPADLPRDARDRYQLINAGIADVNGEIDSCSVDWIITDPPYPREHLPVYSELSDFAERVLKPGGSLIAMVGQSYLPEIINALGEHLSYHWTLAYLTPGGQAVQLWNREVNTFWKPLLWFVKGEYAGDWIGDVCKSDVNDNDKRHHGWGQSESGMADIIERFTYPGQMICDPFVGGGTTGVVAVKMNRRFVGIDLDADAIETTSRRLAEVV